LHEQFLQENLIPVCSSSLNKLLKSKEKQHSWI